MHAVLVDFHACPEVELHPHAERHRDAAILAGAEIFDAHVERLLGLDLRQSVMLPSAVLDSPFAAVEFDAVVAEADGDVFSLAPVFAFFVGARDGLFDEPGEGVGQLCAGCGNAGLGDGWLGARGRWQGEQQQ